MVVSRRSQDGTLASGSVRLLGLENDARLFNGTGGYPSLEEVDRMRARLFPGLRMTVEHDIIRLLPG